MATLSKALKSFETLFGRLQSAIIGVVHLPALPGTPKSRQTVPEIIQYALRDMEIYSKHGLDGVIIENTHDIPYMKSPHVGPEITATMSRICCEIRHRYPKLPLGVQILAGANEEAIAVAHACGLDFVRVESFVFGSVADEGFMDACAGPLLRMRRRIGAENVLVFADIKKKHSSHAITADLSVEDIALAADFFAADGVIITGKTTGHPVDPQEASVTQRAVQLPVILGSGVQKLILHGYVGSCNGMIVGSDFKRDGKWYNELEESRVEEFMKEVRKLRKAIVDEEATAKKQCETT